jgi:hypothetical protein
MVALKKYANTGVKKLAWIVGSATPDERPHRAEWTHYPNNKVLIN